MFDGLCIGLFCNINEVITKDFNCMASEQFYLPTYYNATYIYFYPTRKSSPLKTESEKYLRTLKSNRVKLNMRRRFDTEFFVTQMPHYYDKYFTSELNLISILDFVPKNLQISDFTKLTMPFIASFNDSAAVIVDYDCSVVDVNLKTAKIVHELDEKFGNFVEGTYWTRPIFYVVILILIASLKELREKLNSKLLVIYSINEIVLRILIYLEVDAHISNKFIFELIAFTKFSSFVLLLIISYDYWIVIR